MSLMSRHSCWIVKVAEGDGHLCYSLDGGLTKFMDLIQLVDFYQLNAGALPTHLTYHVTRLWHTPGFVDRVAPTAQSPRVDGRWRSSMQPSRACGWTSKTAYQAMMLSARLQRLRESRTSQFCSVDACCYLGYSKRMSCRHSAPGYLHAVWTVSAVSSSIPELLWLLVTMSAACWIGNQLNMWRLLFFRHVVKCVMLRDSVMSCDLYYCLVFFDYHSIV